MHGTKRCGIESRIIEERPYNERQERRIAYNKGLDKTNESNEDERDSLVSDSVQKSNETDDGNVAVEPQPTNVPQSNTTDHGADFCKPIFAVHGVEREGGLYIHKPISTEGKLVNVLKYNQKDMIERQGSQ